ncbi:restriction endonuclease subunit S [Acinetobacter johnsonii]|nr:restriction endonuclease subunit S [Acinetobacter johnsonii]MDH1707255.1 restriction endonuclease subunit S [Acinetobacter johnsonii]
MATPKLRFKEFDGDWANFNLGDISDIKTGPFGSTLHQKDYVEIGTPIITVEHLGEVGLTSQNLPLVSDEDKVRLKSYMLDEGDLAFSRVGSVDRCAIITDKEKGWLFSGRILRVRPNKKLVHSKNLMYALKTEDAKYRIRSVAVGQTMPSLNTEILKNFSINLSNSVEEQTKIASFLSVVDEKISQLTQKHELLSQYKQGMMQKLFSQQIRFKADDGSEFGEWEEKTLIDSVDTNIKWSFTGGPFGSNLKSEDYTELGIRIIQLQNIGDGAFLNDYKIYTSPEKANELLSCNIYPDEILISKMGDPVARCCIVPKHHDRYVMCSDGIRLVVDKKNYSSIFMFYQINYQDFRQSASDVSTGSTRKRIGLSDLKQLPIKAPCLEEQTKIANFLSSIDQKIEVVAQQIEQAKQWKKGLLQQMFV